MSAVVGIDVGAAPTTPAPAPMLLNASPTISSRLSGPTAVVLTVLQIGLARPAMAGEPDPQEQMLELNRRGFELFEEGRFVEAAQSFQQAYQLSPDPNLRKNEAIAWFKAGRCGAAIPAANGFLLAEETGEQDRAEARAVLANCKVDMARQAMEHEQVTLARDLLAEAESLQPDRYTRERIASARADLPTSSTPLADPGLHDGVAETGGQNLAAWSLVGAGAALFASAVVYHLVTSDREDEFLHLASEGGDEQRFDELGEQLDTARWLLPTLYLAGAASSGVGAYLLISTDEATAPTPESAGPAGERGTTVSAGLRIAFP